MEMEIIIDVFSEWSECYIDQGYEVIFDHRIHNDTLESVDGK